MLRPPRSQVTRLSIATPSSASLRFPRRQIGGVDREGQMTRTASVVPRNQTARHHERRRGAFLKQQQHGAFARIDRD